MHSISTVFSGAMMAAAVPPPNSSSGGSEGDCFAPVRSKILIVDDEKIMRKSLCRALGRVFQLAPQNILQAPNVASGIQVFDGERDYIQAVFTDMLMPGGLGLEIYFHVRKYSEQTPVVFTSGGMPDDARDELDRILAQDARTRFYEKPNFPGREIVPWISHIWGI